MTDEEVKLPEEQPKQPEAANPEAKPEEKVEGNPEEKTPEEEKKPDNSEEKPEDGKAKPEEKKPEEAKPAEGKPDEELEIDEDEETADEEKKEEHDEKEMADKLTKTLNSALAAMKAGNMKKAFSILQSAIGKETQNKHADEMLKDAAEKIQDQQTEIAKQKYSLDGVNKELDELRGVKKKYDKAVETRNNKLISALIDKEIKLGIVKKEDVENAKKEYLGTPISKIKLISDHLDKIPTKPDTKETLKGDEPSVEDKNVLSEERKEYYQRANIAPEIIKEIEEGKIKTDFDRGE